MQKLLTVCIFESVNIEVASATDCTTDGKEITVELKSKNPKLFHDVKWEFKIKKI